MVVAPRASALTYTELSYSQKQVIVDAFSQEAKTAPVYEGYPQRAGQVVREALERFGESHPEDWTLGAEEDAALSDAGLVPEAALALLPEAVTVVAAAGLIYAAVELLGGGSPAVQGIGCTCGLVTDSALNKIELHSLNGYESHGTAGSLAGFAPCLSAGPGLDGYEASVGGQGVRFEHGNDCAGGYGARLPAELPAYQVITWQTGQWSVEGRDGPGHRSEEDEQMWFAYRGSVAGAQCTMQLLGPGARVTFGSASVPCEFEHECREPGPPYKCATSTETEPEGEYVEDSEIEHTPMMTRAGAEAQGVEPAQITPAKGRAYPEATTEQISSGMAEMWETQPQLRALLETLLAEDAPATTHVPDCFNDTLAACDGALSAAGLEAGSFTESPWETFAERVEAGGTTAGPGKVELEIPAAGDELATGSFVELELAPGYVELPRAAPESEDAVEYAEQLERAGFNNVHVDQASEKTSKHGVWEDDGVNTREYAREHHFPWTAAFPSAEGAPAVEPSPATATGAAPSTETRVTVGTEAQPAGAGGGGGTYGPLPPTGITIIDPPGIKVPSIKTPCTVFPFGVPCWLYQEIKQFEAARKAPNWTFQIGNGGVGSQPLHVNLGSFFGYNTEPILEVVRPVLLFLSFLGCIMWLSKWGGGTSDGGYSFPPMASAGDLSSGEW